MTVRATTAASFCLILALSGWLQAQDGVTHRALRRDAQPQTGREGTGGQGDLYALVVGVSKYTNGIDSLKLAHKDAQDFAAFLETQKKVFKSTHVKLLIDEQATKREVEKYLYHQLRRAGKDDTVVLFLSGHGASDPAVPGSFYYLTSDTDPDYLEATAVNMAGRKFLEGVDSPRVLIIADACHSGTIGAISKIRTRSLEPSLQTFMNDFQKAEGVVILTSSKPRQLSQERPELPNGVFTHYLLEALRGMADRDRDGIVTVDEAYDYTYNGTKDKTNGGQLPQKAGQTVGRFPVSVVGDLGSKITLDVWFVAQDPRCMNPECIDPREGSAPCTDPLCGEVTLTDGAEMYSGQNYQIGFRLQQKGYVYVYQIDSAGSIQRLFPDGPHMAPDNRISNPLEPGIIYWIPGETRWLFLDDNRGEEKIYVIASRTRNQRLEDLYKNLEKARSGGGDRGGEAQVGNQVMGTFNNVLGASAGTRGKRPFRRDTSAPKAPGRMPDKKRSFEELSSAIESSGLDVMKSVRVWHRASGDRR